VWKFTQKFRNCEASSFTNFLVNTLNKIITHYRWSTTSLFIVNICLPTWTFYTIVLQFFHSLHFGCKLQLARLSIAGHIINHSVGDKKIGDQLYVMVYKAMSHVTLPRMHELSPAPTLLAKNKERLLSE
jgi:hypothetical protein